MDTEYNVVCVKHGTKYSPDYVNKLRAMVKRNLTLPHRFICFTEDSTGLDPDIEVLPLPNEKIDGWWFKLFLFQNPLYDLTGKTLYLDLDVVIVDNIDCFLTYSDNFCIIQDWNSRPERNRMFYNSSIFSFEIGKYPHVWNNFITEAEKHMKETRGGDQIWITNQIPKATIWPSNWCLSYKKDCQNGLPENSKIIIFHGRPNPHEAHEWQQIKKRRYPTEWIGKYWRL